MTAERIVPNVQGLAENTRVHFVNDYWRLICLSRFGSFQKINQTKCNAQKSASFKTKENGKYTLHPGRYSYYWLAGWVFRVSRGRHHSYFTCYCSHRHSSKAYTGKERVKKLSQSQTNNRCPPDIEWFALILFFSAFCATAIVSQVPMNARASLHYAQLKPYGCL